MRILVSLVAVAAVARATPGNYLPPETEASNGYLGPSSQVELAPYEDNVPSGEYLSNRRDEDLSKRVYLPPAPQNAYLPGVKNSVLPVLKSDPAEKTYLPLPGSQKTYVPHGSSRTKSESAYLSPTRPQSTYWSPVLGTSRDTEPKKTHLPSAAPPNTYLPSVKFENTYLPPDEPRNAYFTPKSFDLEPGNIHLPPKSMNGTYLSLPTSLNTPQRSNPAPNQEYHFTEENSSRESSRTSSSWTSSSGNSNIVSAWSKAKWMVNGDSTREHTGTNQYGGQSLRHSTGYGYPHTDEIVNSKCDYQYQLSDSKPGNDFEHMKNRGDDTV